MPKDFTINYIIPFLRGANQRPLPVNVKTARALTARAVVISQNYHFWLNPEELVIYLRRWDRPRW
jgi:hypothetical protein